MRTCAACPNPLPDKVHGNQKYCFECACRRQSYNRGQRAERQRERLRTATGGSYTPGQRPTDLRLIHCPDISWPEGLTFDRNILEGMVAQFPEGTRFRDRRGKLFIVRGAQLARIGG
jgi:hypothetical protein